MSHHLFSKTHLPFWKERIRSCRSGFAVWIAEYEAGKKRLDSPLPSFPHSKTSSIRYRICFGCKKLDTGAKAHACDSVEKREACVEMYKKILNEEEEVVVEEDEVAPSSDEMKKLQKEVEKLEKKLEAYQLESDENEKVVEQANTYRSALIDVLRELKHFPDIHKDILTNLEEDFPSLEGDVW